MLIPAVALVPSQNIKLPLPPELASTKFCVSPELFETPVPCIVRAKGAATVIVKELRLLNVIPATVVFAEIPTEVVLDRPKVATSDAPLGKPVLGVQFELVFQSPAAGIKVPCRATGESCAYHAEQKQQHDCGKKGYARRVMGKLKVRFHTFDPLLGTPAPKTLGVRCCEKRTRRVKRNLRL